MKLLTMICGCLMGVLAMAGDPNIPSTTFDSQYISVASSETAFPAVTSGIGFTSPSRIHVGAASTNSDTIFIGKTGLTTASGAILSELEAGEFDVLPVSDRTILYHIANDDAQKLIIIYLPEGQ